MTGPWWAQEGPWDEPWYREMRSQTFQTKYAHRWFQPRDVVVGEVLAVRDDPEPQRRPRQRPQYTMPDLMIFDEIMFFRSAQEAQDALAAVRDVAARHIPGPRP